MDNTDRHIAGLWADAKEEAPQRSLTEVQASFSATVANGGAGSGASSKSGFNSIINLNGIIMSSIVIVAASLVWSLWPSAEIKTAIAEQEKTAIGNELPAERNQRTVIVTVPNKRIEKQDISSDDLLELEGDDEKVSRKLDRASDSQSSKRIDEKREVTSYTPTGTWEYGGSQSTVIGGNDGETEVLFVITNDTKTEELEHIKDLADKAGINFEYETRGSIRWIHLKMTMDKEDGESETSITMKGNFEMQIGWVEDDNGKALRFNNGNDDDEIGLFGEAGTPFMEIPDIPAIPELLGNNEVPVLAAGEERVIIHINRSTTEAEIKQYELEADRVGLKLQVHKFNPNGKRLKIKLDGPEARMQLITDVDSRDEPLEATFGWVIDESGNYVRFLESEEIELELD